MLSVLHYKSDPFAHQNRIAARTLRVAAATVIADIVFCKHLQATGYGNKKVLV